MTAKGAPSRILPSLAEEPGRAPLYVVFTNFESTRRALLAARDFSHELGFRLVLLFAQVVPYPLPLDSPPVAAEFREKLLAPLAREFRADLPVRVFLCRDRDEAIRAALVPGSVVVIGTAKQWWIDKDRRLGHRLSRDGQKVILIGIGQIHGVKGSCIERI